jgi:hypothetical protein
MKRIATLAAALMLSTSAAHAACTTATPVDLPILQAAIDSISNGGANDGSYSFAGAADCPTSAPPPAFDPSETLAVASALSMPIWLGDKENFAVSGGIGFSDDAAAIGATAVARINGNLAAFAGGAVSTESSDLWAGRAGLRFGW